MIKEYAKNKIIRVVGAAYLSCMVLCILFFLLSREKVVYEDNSVYLIPAGNQEMDVATGISLYPGKYEVRVSFDMETDELYGGFVYVNDDNVRARGLESVGGPLYQGRNEAECGFSYMDHTGTLRVTMRSFNESYVVNSIRIVNTGKMWTVTAFVLTVITVLGLLFYIFVDKTKKGEIKKERAITICVLAFVTFITILPMMYQNTESTADDGYHKQRIEGVVSALESFHFPVRLEPHWVQGYGYANGLFYCDLYLVFPAILRILGLSVTAAYNWYVSAVCIATVLVSFYSYKRIFKKEKTALILCALYSLSIMKVFKLVSGGALGEGTAIVFLPLILLGLYEVLYRDSDDKYAERMGFVHLGIGSAGLVMCHILSTTITIATIGLFAVLNILRLFKNKNVFRLILAGITAAVLSLWFAVPFVEYYLLEDVHIKHAYARPIQFMGVFIPQIVYLFYNNYGSGAGQDKGMYHYVPQGIGFLLFAGITVSVIILIYELLKKKNKVSGFYVHMIILSVLFFAFSLNCFPWDAIQSVGGPIKAFVSSLQFPARFLQWDIVFLVAAIGFVISYLEKNYKKESVNILLTAGLIIYSVSFLFLQDGYMRNATWYYIENAEGVGTGYISGGEYKPEGTDENLCFYNRTDHSDNVTISDFQAGSLKGEMYVTNDSGSDGWAEYPLLNYRGYKAYDKNGNKFEIVSGYNNVIRVIVPEGYDGNITVRFISPFYWRISEIISLFGILSVILYVRQNRKKGIYFSEKAANAEETEGVDENIDNRFPVIVLGVFALIIPSLPYLSGYVFEGTYINEVLAPFLHIEEALGIKAEVFYFLTLLAILVAAYTVNRYVIKKAAILLGNNIGDSNILSTLCVLIYFTSPILLYTLYNRIAVWDWIVMLLLPVIIGELVIVFSSRRSESIKLKAVDLIYLLAAMVSVIICYIISNPAVNDYDTLSIPLRIAKIFDMFPHKGEFNYKLYLAYPVQNNFAFVALTVISIIVFVKNRQVENSIDKKTKSISVQLAVTILIGMAVSLIASLPVVFSMLPNVLLRVIGPQSLIALSSAILIFSIPLFKVFIERYVKNSTVRYIIYTILMLIVLFSVMYQINDICYDSSALRYNFNADAIN